MSEDNLMSPSNTRYRFYTGSLNVVHNVRQNYYKMHLNHFYSKYEIYYLISGERYYFTNGQMFQIQAGDIVFTNPYAMDETIDVGTPDHIRLAISFEEDYFDNIPKDQRKLLFKPFLTNFNILRFNGDKQYFIKDISQKITDEIIQKNEGFEINLYGLIIELLVFCSRNISTFKNETFIPTNPAYSNIAKIVDYINKNFSTNITLSQLSKQFYLSPTYLSKTFKKVTGFTFVEYLNLIRINEAKDRLRRTNETIIQIAISTGFGNISNFNRVFKKLNLISPTEFKRSFRNDKGSNTSHTNK